MRAVGACGVALVAAGVFDACSWIGATDRGALGEAPGGVPYHLHGAHGFTLGSMRLPTREDLAAIMATPPPPPPSATTAVVDHWELAGPFPATFGELLADEHPSQAILRVVLGDAAARSVRPASLHCAAREEARFRVRHAEPMPSALMAFVKSRCGITHRDLYFDHVYRRQLDARESDVEVVQAFAASAARTVARAIPPGESREVGAAYVREGDVAMLVVAYARPKARLVATPRARDAQGNVLLQGRLEQTPQRLEASITQGELGVAACAIDPGVRRPDFRITCPMAPGDAAATVELYTQPEGSIVEGAEFAVHVGEVAAFPRAFSRPAADAQRPSVADRRAAFVAALNEVRARAGAGPLRLHERQSEALCAMAPWMVAATRGLLPPEQSDRLYLGVGAGHEMDELIGDASALAHVSFTGEVHASLEEQLAGPIMRRALLRPTMDRVAVCPAVDDRGTLVAVLWALYDVLGPDDRVRDAQGLLARINAERARAHLAPLVPSAAATAAADRATLRLMGNAVTPQGAMVEALEEVNREEPTRIVNRRLFTVAAWWALGLTVNTMRLPDGPTYGSPRGVGVAVAHLPMPGSHWAARVALVVGMREPEQ